MRLDKGIRKELLNSYFRIKGMGVFAIIPVVILYFFIPFINFSVFYYLKDMDMLYESIVNSCQILVPICSVWYVIFILYHLVEESGKEVLYVYSKDKFKDLLLPYMTFLVLLLPLFCIYTYMFPELWFFYLQLCAIDFFCLAFAYSMAFAFNSISVSVIGILMYSILTAMLKGKRSNLFIYQEAMTNPKDFLLLQISPYVIAAFLLLFMGKLANKYFLRYK